MNKNVLVVTGYTDDFRQKEIPDNTILVNLENYYIKHQKLDVLWLTQL
jgi:hypothetical protein